MKKSKILKAILSPIIKGLAIFAIFGLAVYVYGAISYPESEPNPVSGVVGIFVGTTASAVDGSRGGYNSANETYCDIEDNTALAGSHICTAMEMINTYNHNPSAFDTYTSGKMWINNGPPAYTKTLSNDCSGWNSNSSATFGSVWNFENTPPLIPHSAYIQPCNFSYPFACCK